MAFKCKFVQDWLIDPQFKEWLRPVTDDPFSAICTICTTKFCLSNMGKRAVRSHLQGKKHQLIQKNRGSAYGMDIFLSRNAPVASPTVFPSTSQACTSQACTSQATFQDPESLTEDSLSCRTISGPSTSNTSPQNLRGMERFVLNESVTKTEIVWCMLTVMSHNSVRSADRASSLFKVMFPDSAIAQKLQLGRTKITYIVTYGLAPHFHNELLEMCTGCSQIVIGFDESLNKVSQKGQMDVVVRFWNDKSSRVVTRYFCSAFLGHATAADLLSSLTAAISGLNMKKILQVSMDGPNVNLKCLRDLRDFLRLDINDPVILDIGTCGLHNLHCAFKASVKATSWKIVEFLRALYYLFKNVPVRRADYTFFSGSTLFPLKFCSVRWLENTQVSERAVAIVPHVLKYVEGVTKKKVPLCNSFGRISDAMKDKLLVPKLVFFHSMAAMVEPFLKDFQSDTPMAPLLYEALSSLLRNIMVKFVKPETMDSDTPVTSIDILNTNILIPSKKIDIGYATRDALRTVKDVCDKDILLFRENCRQCMQTLCNKLMQRSPLKYRLTKGISCLDPLIAVRPIIRNNRLKQTLNILVENKWLSGTTADRVDTQFKSVCDTDNFMENMKAFSKEKERLDDLWLKILTIGQEYSDLLSFVKMILILSHGNANLERGFSINRECLIENLREESLVAQRQVYDGITAAGGLDEIVSAIPKKLLISVRNAHSRYTEALQGKKHQQDINRSAETDRKRAGIMAKELEVKKKKLLEQARQEAALIDAEIKAIRK